MEETRISLSNIVKMFTKRRILIFNTVFCAIILVFVVNLTIPPVYEAETSLRVKQPKGLADSPLTPLPVGINTQQLMSTYVEILKSRTVVQSVIDKINADNSDIMKYEDVVKRITTQPIKDTEILKIKVQAKSPEEAQLVANTLVLSFNDRLIFLARSEQTAVKEFIGQRVKETRLELDKAESMLEEYKRNEKVLAPSEETKAILDRMTKVKQMNADNAVNIAMAQARYNAAERLLSAEKPGFVADSPLIQQYKGKLADMEVELVGLSQNYGESHPRIQALKASIEETRQKLNNEAARVINVEAPSINPIHQGLLQSRIQAEADMEASRAQQDALGQIMGQSEQEIMNLPAKEQGIARLMRDASVAQEIYVMLAKRYEEAKISEFMQPTNLQVIDVAIAPEQPIAPQKTRNLLIGALLGLLVGVGASLLLEYSNHTIYNAEEAKQWLNLPVLGTVPDFDDEYGDNEKGHGLLSQLKRVIRYKK